MKIESLRHLIIIAFIALLGACTPLKEIKYLQDDGKPVLDSAMVLSEQYKIQPNDNLFIQVLTSDDVSGKYFNLSTNDRYMTTDAAIELESYKVNENGAIDFPMLGIINVSGLTTLEIKKLIEEGVNRYLQQASVIVKHVNRTFTLLGEVTNPGTFSIYKDRLTIFEALGYGGDINDYGNRKNVKLIRHNGDEKEVVELDLTQKNIIYSKFYYILPNDIIYIEPSSRVFGTKTLPFSTVLTAVNTAVTLFYLINSFSNN
jgi:polysaccharide biosynthesis/export protein